MKRPVDKTLQTDLVSMPDEEQFAIEVKFRRTMVYGYVQFTGQVVAYPQIVVAREKMYGDAAVGYFGQFTKQTQKTTWNHVPVFEPEIEYVAQ